MSKTDLDFFLNQNVQIELSNFVLSLLCAAFLSFIVHLFYIRFSSSLSNRVEFSKNFVILGVATCIVIMIVKSSLALSLGLVGALSIVRFRAAIKEPEELVYLFLIIAVGLGCGANQLIITFVGILFALATILIYSKYLQSTNANSSEVINMGIIIDENMSDTQINTLMDDLSKETIEVKFISMSRTKSNTSINIDLRPNNFKDLTKITEKIKEQYSNSKTILAHNDDLSL
jgi:positive regulator of sigma E activity|tara:strand:- start:847 stop:1539 length:693 start_codon:yes stop_codon:yes gene_type:complete